MSKKKTETQAEAETQETVERSCVTCEHGGEDDESPCFRPDGVCPDGNLEHWTEKPVAEEAEKEKGTDSENQVPPPKVNNRFDMELRVMLTEEEKREMASKAMQGIGSLRDMREDKKAVVKGWDSRIADLEGEVQKLSEKHEKGWDIRPVPCEEIHNYATGRATVIRTDTGEMVKERLLTQSEMQFKLPIEDAKQATEQADIPGIPIAEGGNPHPEESAGMVKIEES